MGEKQQINGEAMLEWFDDCYITKVLTAYEGESVEIKNYKKQLATSKGENYASVIHLVTTEYVVESGNNELKTISMIVKSRLDNEFMTDIEEEFNVFERESQVYKCIMASCENMLQSIGYNVKFGPRAIYVDDRVIIQENLKEKGYAIENVKNGLDYEHCKKVLEKLAQFHGSTMILNQKNPNILKYHQQGNMSEVYTPLHDLYKNALRSCIEYIKTIPKLVQYVEKLENYSQNVIEKLIKVFSRNPTEINALNHGDVWVNNLLFKKDSSENIVDVLFVDYQEGYFGSPGIDLNYFIYTSWQKDLHIYRKNELIKHYHNNLIDTLSKLNYQKQLPTLEDIHREIRLKGDHGLITATCLYPILISDHRQYADPVTFLTDTEEAKRNRLIVFNNPKYVDFLQLVLKDFTSQGIL